MRTLKTSGLILKHTGKNELNNKTKNSNFSRWTTNNYGKYIKKNNIYYNE